MVLDCLENTLEDCGINMFMFDIETLGVESTTVILSAGIIHFDPVNDADVTYEELVARGLFVKFNAKDQIKRLDRTMTKSTLDWWGKQGEWQQKTNFVPNAEEDLLAEDGIRVLKKYVNKYNTDGEDKVIMWARGSLDQMAFDSLCNKAGVESLVNFSRWRDVRTAVDMLTGSTNGYCKVDGLDWDVVAKHHPVHDCALDILMLVRGISEES